MKLMNLCMHLGHTGMIFTLRRCLFAG